MRHIFRTTLFVAMFLAASLLVAAVATNCTYLQDPSQFLYSPHKHWSEISIENEKVALALRPVLNRLAVTAADAKPDPTPRKNFIDEYIFSRMERDGITPSPLSDDQAFFRRVNLDLTGRIPSADQVRAFAYDTNPAKRDVLVDSLIGNAEFVDKWTMFFGDLYKNNANATNVNRYFQGRDAFYSYLKNSIATNKLYHHMAYEIITANGDSFVDGPTNWIVGGTVPMGPVQDTYDGQAVNLGSMFLGLNTVDCLLCHDGARHLDSVNLWGKQQKRADLWGLSAFFARTQMPATVVSQNPQYVKRTISDLTTGDYRLNTTTGNRTTRAPINGNAVVAPKYPFTNQTVGANANRRVSLANMVTADPQFSRAIVNYIWEKLMVVAFVTPSNAFDPARLDPNNPPAEPWTLQPTNPELLAALSQWFRDNNYDLRALIALIAKSNAYQLSSQYPGEWKAEYVPYYARKFARRLDAEEIHDAIVKAAGVPVTYSLDYNGSTYPLPPVNWAMQLPDTIEPRGTTTAQFLNGFGRGDRDQSVRDSSGSPIQALNMMNHTFIMTRIHSTNNGSTVQSLLRQTSDPLGIIENLYLTTLNRFPMDAEIPIAAATMKRLGNTAGAQSLQWALLNKLEFIYSY